MEEELDIKQSIEFFNYAYDVCKEKGKMYEFECPFCKKKATAIKNDYNGHLWCECKNCDIKIIQ